MNGETLLRLEGVSAGYGHVPVVEGVEFEVRAGELVAILGSNGAGKSTLLGTIAGVTRPLAGSIRLAGEEIGGARPERIVEAGLVLVPEGRRLFRGLTVAENLELGLWRCGLPPAEERERRDWVVELFPVLGERLDRAAEIMSGGEQQMLVIAQALMRRPRVLLLDEPSLGLAPVVVERVLATVDRLLGEGLTVVLVEQVVEQTLALADHAVVLQRGRIVASGSGDELLAGDRVRGAYLGATAPGG